MDRETEAITVAGLLRDAEGVLSEAGVPTPRLDAEVLMSMVMRANRAALYARLQDEVARDVEARFLAAVDRRRRREPVAYITGVREFRSLPIAVTPAVLVPRPETELLVEVVCDLMAREPRPSVCEIGAGSGCVSVAVARALPPARVLAVDVSRAALAVARRNAVANEVEGRVSILCSDMFTGVAARERFDVVVSNPPYVAVGDPVPPELAWEPGEALTAGADGLQMIRRLVAGAPAHLRDGGWLVMEIGYGQEGAVRRLAVAGGFDAVSIRPDLAGIPRVMVGRVASSR